MSAPAAAPDPTLQPYIRSVARATVARQWLNVAVPALCALFILACLVGEYFIASRAIDGREADARSHAVMDSVMHVELQHACVMLRSTERAAGVPHSNVCPP